MSEQVDVFGYEETEVLTSIGTDQSEQRSSASNCAVAGGAVYNDDD